MDGVNQGQADIGVEDFKRDAGEAGTATYIEYMRRHLLKGKCDGEGVEEVLQLHLLIVHDGGEVYPPIPADKLFIVYLETRYLLVCEGQPHPLGPVYKPFHFLELSECSRIQPYHITSVPVKDTPYPGVDLVARIKLK